jgi:hypothetical protein
MEQNMITGHKIIHFIRPVIGHLVGVHYVHNHVLLLNLHPQYNVLLHYRKYDGDHRLR